MNCRLLFLFCLCIGLGACSNEQDASNENSGKVTEVANHNGIAFYGSVFEVNNAITGQVLRRRMDSMHECHAVIKGQVTDVCKKEGCWLNLDLGSNYSMQVSLHKFHVPKDCEGRIAYIYGRAYMDTTSVIKLRDFAADAGKPASEIDTITHPKVEMIFEAKGVGLK